eukprot:1904295-Rhodomonas_salina.1
MEKLNHKKLVKVLSDPTASKKDMWPTFMQFMNPSTIPMTIVLHAKDEGAIKMILRDIRYIRNMCWRQATIPQPSNQITNIIQEMISELDFGTGILPNIEYYARDTEQGRRKALQNIANDIDKINMGQLRELCGEYLRDFIIYLRERFIQNKEALPKEIQKKVFENMYPPYGYRPSEPTFETPPDKYVTQLHRWLRERKHFMNEIANLNRK